jgi:hypothetical protein
MAKSCRCPVTTAQIFLAACIPRRADRHQRSQRETSTSPAVIQIDASVNAGKPSKIGAVLCGAPSPIGLGGHCLHGLDNPDL